jgi:hypothetical protein
VIVDSTKEPPFAFVVRGIPSVDFRLVHLVRDSRGVAYSFMKHKRRPEVLDAPAIMGRLGPVSASFWWLDTNLLCHALASGGRARLMIKYEDLVASPCDVVARIARHAGEAVAEEQVAGLIDGKRPLRVNHSIAGNPVRFHKGPVRLRLDDEWRSRMRRRDRLLVTALTAPLLRSYGYVAVAQRSQNTSQLVRRA